MKFLYLFSFLYFMISFLMYKKSNKSLSFIGSIVYFICLFFCYNTVVVYFYSLFSIGGSLIPFSVLNYIIGTILFIITWKRKSVQHYRLDKKETIIYFCVILVCLIVVCSRFDNFNVIRYESGDASIHYRHAQYFSKELSLLSEENANDVIYGSFDDVMSISYINGGLLLHLFSENSSYKVFLMYDGFCFLLCSLLFLTTFFEFFRLKRSSYFYSFVVTLLYILAFPLNSFLFGFCYLGLSVMVVNLLLLTVWRWKDNFDENVLEKLIILFFITFSVFYSYYLFVPCVYLALGLYYIYLYKSKCISMKKMFVYGIVTLIIPFLIGFVYFILPGFIDTNDGNIFTYVNLWGYTYDNITPIYLFIVFTTYFVYDWIKNKRKLDYFYLNLLCITGYILIFFILYIFKFVNLYYFYKLFYVYWGFVILFLSYRFFQKKKYVYLLLGILSVGGLYIFLVPDSGISNVLTKVDIYHWNMGNFYGERALFTEEELQLLEESMEYQDICEYHDEFLIIGDSKKNLWFYAITDSIPVLNHEEGHGSQLHHLNPTFQYWNYLKDYDCVVYFYEGNEVEYDREDYEILYENTDGAILKKIKK